MLRFLFFICVFFVRRCDEHISEISEKRNAEKKFHSKLHPILLFFIAFGEAMMSHSAVLCYFAMILNTLMSGSILSLPFPILIFFWAMLSVPRPTKRYWIAIITYTEV